MLLLLLACSTLEVTEEGSKEEIGTVPPSAVPMPSDEVEEEPVNVDPRILSAKFSAQSFSVEDEVRVNVEADDPEGQPIRTEFEWAVNDQPRPSETREYLRRTELKRGDRIDVKIIVSDGVAFADRSLQTTIVNAEPTWESDPRGMTDINGFTVKAIDADGDMIQYSLLGQPTGMSISSSGELSYLGSTDEPGGAYSISVLAKDGQGGQVQWAFSINLSAGSKAQ